MATAFTHALVGASFGFGAEALPRRRLLLAGAALAVLPDLDVVAFSLGIPYAHPLGHRGFSHSLLFALIAGLAVTAAFFRRVPGGAQSRWRVAAVLVLAGASHGVLDGFTDAGLGVGFFLPFDDTRYFFPWRPLATSPIGIDAFFSGPALRILGNELVFVLLPWTACLALVRSARGITRAADE